MTATRSPIRAAPLSKTRILASMSLACAFALGMAPPVQSETKSEAMLPKSCPESALLPSARAMRSDHPQRIPYPEGNADDVGVYGKLTNGQRISGHLSAEVKAGIGAQSGALLRNGLLSPALREMIIVRTGYHTASAYEVTQHRSLGASLGVSEAKLDALACVRPAGLEADEAAVIAFVDELLTMNRPNDATVAAVRERFTDGQLMEIIFVTGNWWTLARMLETAGIPIDARRIGDAGLAPAKDGH